MWDMVWQFCKATTVALGCCVVVGGVVHFDKVQEYLGVSLETPCERLDRRCREFSGGANLRGAMTCGVIGLSTISGRSEKDCRRGNELLDRRQ